MVDIASCSHYATTTLVYDLHHIARSMLHQIGEEHRIASYDQEASTSHGPSIRPTVSSTPVHMQPIRGRGRVDPRGRGRDGGRSHGRDGEGSRGTPQLTLPTSIPPPPHTYPSPEIFIPPQTYTSPSIPPNTYTSLPYSVSPEPASIAVDITLSSHPLSSPTLPSIGDTIVDLVSELGTLPTRRPHAPRIHRVLHPSTPSAPSAPFEIARDPIDQLVVYYRRHPKRNIKTSSYGTH